MAGNRETQRTKVQRNMEGCATQMNSINAHKPSLL